MIKKLILLFLAMMITDQLIKELIACKKTVVEAPKDIKEGRSGFKKRTFTLISLDGLHSFSGFITQNLTFIENFSIGLSYSPKDEKGKIVLLRCNGPHGGTKNSPHHASCHIHTSTAERINNGLKPEGQIDITNDYSTIEDAIQFYIRRINIDTADRQKYFSPPSGQIDLFTQIADNI